MSFKYWSVAVIGVSFLLSVARADAATIISEAAFYYKPDAEAHYLELNMQWQEAHSRKPTSEEALPLLKNADQMSTIEQPLTQWSQQSGTRPMIIRPRVVVQNKGDDAQLNLKVMVVVRARVGNISVDPALGLTDYNALKNSAQWEVWANYSAPLPILVGGENTVWRGREINLQQFLKNHPARWPESLQLEVQLTRGGKPFQKKQTLLKLVPDEFVSSGS